MLQTFHPFLVTSIFLMFLAPGCGKTNFSPAAKTDPATQASGTSADVNNGNVSATAGAGGANTGNVSGASSGSGLANGNTTGAAAGGGPANGNTTGAASGGGPANGNVTGASSPDLTNLMVGVDALSAGGTGGKAFPPATMITDFNTLAQCKMYIYQQTGDFSVCLKCYQQWLAQGQKLTAKDCGCIQVTPTK